MARSLRAPSSAWGIVMATSGRNASMVPVPRFLCDAMLGSLARWLRLFGFDCLFSLEEDSVLAERAAREGRWLLCGGGRTLEAERVVLATGHESALLDLRYLGIKGLWGSRGDYATQREFPVSMHKDFSLSSTRNGRVKLGATHVKNPDPCLACDGRPLAALEAKAAELADTSDFRLVETFCGMRSGSRDFFPVVGPLIDVEAMLREHPSIVRGAKAPLCRRPDLYILNGLGGRGFVFAPLMARWLAEHLVRGAEIDSRVHPDRLFWKWVRRSVD